MNKPFQFIKNVGDSPIGSDKFNSGKEEPLDFDMPIKRGLLNRCSPGLSILRSYKGDCKIC